MNVKIQFLDGLNENSSPIVKLTKSVSGKTGTATFIFIEPNVFENLFVTKNQLISMTLLFENKKISTTDIAVIFKNGKPFLLKSILIFKSSNEWFDFLIFMNLYSKENGLLFES